MDKIIAHLKENGILKQFDLIAVYYYYDKSEVIRGEHNYEVIQLQNNGERVVYGTDIDGSIVRIPEEASPELLKRFFHDMTNRGSIPLKICPGTMDPVNDLECNCTVDECRASFCWNNSWSYSCKMKERLAEEKNAFNEKKRISKMKQVAANVCTESETNSTAYTFLIQKAEKMMNYLLAAKQSLSKVVTIDLDRDKEAYYVVVIFEDGKPIKLSKCQNILAILQPFTNQESSNFEFSYVIEVDGELDDILLVLRTKFRLETNSSQVKLLSKYFLGSTKAKAYMEDNYGFSPKQLKIFFSHNLALIEYVLSDGTEVYLKHEIKRALVEQGLINGKETNKDIGFV